LLVAPLDYLEDDAVTIPVEVIWPEEVGYLYDGFRVDDDTAKDATLGLDVVVAITYPSLASNGSISASVNAMPYTSS
jgi:hypothetical protein